MLHWNHRVMKRRIRIGGKSMYHYDIREVFYEGKRPDMFTQEAMAPGGSSLEDLREELVMMLKATYQPVFKASDIKRRRAP